MDWIFDHFQLVVVAVFVIGSLVKSVIEGKLKRGDDQAGPWPEAEVPLDEDKSYRKPVADTARPSKRAANPPPLPEPGYETAVADERARALKHQRDLAERLRQIRETKATTTGGAAATRARVEAKSAKKSAKNQPMRPLSVRDRLRDPAELRRAFVMREILDPPVSLR
ncbi:hypothetical protein JIN84_04505 [Luteolibacter yonseiensis]|uniref:Uncharacterized protein n=1 Tax=Luteolibacter yonseiensis TaxID=1144680 RepID=A0A934QY66_9BACT|nr:hypothetical protein [Luteolibacter yonseiensis]MBK1814863.1 hypothetical protein [Luteolibacter yonseiensis]